MSGVSHVKGYIAQACLAATIFTVYMRTAGKTPKADVEYAAYMRQQRNAQ